MLLALIAFLGITFWLIFGVLALVLWNRHKFRKRGKVFAFKGYTESGSVPGFGKKYPWRSAYAIWVNDVLILNKGIALIRAIPIGVADIIGISEVASNEKIKRMGEKPFVVHFRTENDAIIHIAVRRKDACLAIGPFEQPKAERTANDNRKGTPEKA